MNLIYIIYYTIIKMNPTDKPLDEPDLVQPFGQQHLDLNSIFLKLLFTL